CVDCHQAGPWRTEAGKVPERFAIFVARLGGDGAAARLRIWKLRVFGVFVVAGIRLNPSGRRLVFRVHENVSQLGIGGRSTPVGSTGESRKDQSWRTTVRFVEPRRVRT